MVEARISIEQVGLYARNKKQLYNSMVKNHYYMPAFKQTIVTLEFMQLVREGKLWVPLA